LGSPMHCGFETHGQYHVSSTKIASIRSLDAKTHMGQAKKIDIVNL
tara:strand:- start:1111 stop:1248 length:138 start_codon:yes stop_codon:yes gene_type:complete